ncbi:MAG: hypothetical protein C0623_07775 [Desulfuromonas sp.]|nr:MAG: hypothetical protein C0623_07775 [Desulfuromonas sp.]
MDSDHKLAWAIFISIGCHLLIFVAAIEFAPWKILKSGQKSRIVVHLNTPSAVEPAATTTVPKKTVKIEEKVKATPPPTVVKVQDGKKKSPEEIPAQPEPAAAPAPQQPVVSDQPLIRDRSLGNLMAKPQNEGTGDWQAEYARKLRELIEENQRYPVMASRNRLQGTVMVGFILNRSGNLLECHITQSCQHKILDRAALRAVKSVKSFPPFPDSVGWEQAGFVVPVTFRIE